MSNKPRCSVCGSPANFGFHEPGLCEVKTDFCMACFADTYPERIDIAMGAQQAMRDKLAEN